MKRFIITFALCITTLFAYSQRVTITFSSSSSGYFAPTGRYYAGLVRTSGGNGYNWYGARLMKKVSKIRKKIKNNNELTKKEQKFFEENKRYFEDLIPKEPTPKEKALKEYKELVEPINFYTTEFNERRISFEEYLEKTKPLEEKLKSLQKIIDGEE